MKASKAFLFVFLIVLSFCLVTTQHTQSQSSGTIHIRSDGSVEGTDKIQRDGNVYTFTGNISIDYGDCGIEVDRDNIVIDGAGFTLQGTAAYIFRGIDLSGRSNVTIKNMEIRNFMDGIFLVPSSNNTITGNYIMANTDSGIWTAGVSNNITGNYIANNNIGILFEGSHDLIYHNNFINNTKQVEDICWTNPWLPSSANILDDGYPSGGIYWSDYEDRYPNATELDDSGIWDTPYVIDENNQDNYPLMDEGVKFEPYVSTFHLLFEHESHNLLGNLTGELRITEHEKEIIHSICRLSLSSQRLDEYHEPYIHKVELFTAWFFIIHPWGPVEIPQPPPPTQKLTLHVDEETILFDNSDNVSGFENEPRLVFWFSSGTKISGSRWGSLTLPTIRVYFSDGQEWEWKYEYNVTIPFMLWSGIEANLSELSGKVETASITFTTVEKVSPPIIDRLLYLYIVLASTIIVAIAVAAAFVKYRRKKQT